MHGTSCPKSQLESTCLTAKFGSFLDHAETGKKGKKCDQFFCPTSDFFDFCNPCFFYHTFTNVWILLTKPMQKSVTTVCLHSSFARLKNKHIGILGTNVATRSWLHWSPVSGYTLVHESLHRGITKQGNWQRPWKHDTCRKTHQLCALDKRPSSVHCDERLRKNDVDRPSTSLLFSAVLNHKPFFKMRKFFFYLFEY